MALIVFTATLAAIAVALFAFSLCRPRPSREGDDPVVGVQRHGRTFYVPRSVLEADQPSGAWALSPHWRSATLAVLGGSLLLAGLLRLV